MTNEQTLKLALDALTFSKSDSMAVEELIDDAIVALEEALAKQEQPIKEVVINADYREMWKQQAEMNQRLTTFLSAQTSKQEQGEPVIEADLCVMVGYSKVFDKYFVYEETAPQEFCAIKGPFATRIEAENAMRDPNAELINPQPTQLKQEQGEPWGACVSGRVFVGALPEHVRKLSEDEGMPIKWLYTTPQQRTWVGLSVFEINELVENTEYEDYRTLVEETEAKLKEKNNG